MRASALLVLVAACSSDKKPPSPEVAPAPAIDAAKAAVEVDAAPVAKPATAPSRAIDPASLPDWGGAAKGAVVVHAADVDARMLAMAVTDPKKKPLLHKSVAEPALISGRFSAKSELAAYKILASKSEAAAAMAVKMPRGRGREVDLHFWSVEPKFLFKIYADILRTNVVFAARDAAELTLQLRYRPVDAVLAATAEALGLTVREQGTTLVVGANDVALDKQLLKIKKPRLDVRARGARAAEVIAAMAAVAKVELRADCAAGEAIDLSLRAESAGKIAAVLELLAGAEVEATEPSCASETPRAPRDGDAFVAVAANGDKIAAVFRAASGKPMVLVSGQPVDGQPVQVKRRGAVAVGEGDRAVERTLGSAEVRRGDRAAALLEVLGRSRLAATVVRDKRSVAILETPENGFAAVGLGGFLQVQVIGELAEVLPEDEDRLVATTPPFRIEPGKLIYLVTAVDAPAQERSLELAARP